MEKRKVIELQPEREKRAFAAYMADQFERIGGASWMWGWRQHHIAERLKRLDRAKENEGKA